MKIFLSYILLFLVLIQNAQQDSLPGDSLSKKKKIILEEVEIVAEKDNSFGISRLNNIEGTAIYAGKKTEAIYVGDLNANLASNNSRQLFAKVAGINIFENDGSGSQIGIGGRGLNPNRISNFNTRQNGYDISADALGYPESYYTPPTEAIERIEILRGAASLQYGTQFGGMINYKFSRAPEDKKLSGRFRQTGGSFGFFNSFNQISGTSGKLSYNAFYQYKVYQGWRDFSNMNSHNAFVSLNYKINERWSLKAEYTNFSCLSRQPGGLTDKLFYEDSSAVTRTRNWFKVNWNLLSLSSDFKISESAKLNVMSFGLHAGRDALGNIGRPDRKDDTSANRNLLNDVYKNFGAEIRFLQRYHLLGKNSHFLVGTRYYRGQTVRKQGDADKSNKANFNFLNPDNLENSFYTFPSSNYALFIENIFQLTHKWNVTPGVRLEHISTNAEGYYRLRNKDGAGNTLLDMKITDNRSNNRSFLLMGIGTQYKITKDIELYGNISQNYRSINFNDMRVVNPNFQVDPNLKDERGFTADGGMRGIVKNILYFDLSAFMISYKDRIGTIPRVDSITYNIVRYRTNISNSRNLGLEAFAELDWIKLVRKESKHKLSTFINTSFINAVYVNSKEKAYDNKKVEYVPEMIFRTGITYGWKKFSITAQYAYTSEQYSDATNAIFSPSGIYGVIPAYSVIDIAASYTWKNFSVYAGINNASNNMYFSRRAEGYPGPGIIPADPRNLYTTLQFKF
jgi:Fe(3+) dicitrate transport protein